MRDAGESHLLSNHSLFAVSEVGSYFVFIRVRGGARMNSGEARAGSERFVG